MATPIAAGSAALVQQYFQEGWYPTGVATTANKIQPSGALIKAVLLGELVPLAVSSLVLFRLVLCQGFMLDFVATRQCFQEGLYPTGVATTVK